jgi:hypothetical protein
MLAADAATNDVSKLIRQLKDSKNWRVRDNAAEALGETKDPRAVEPLIEALTGDPHLNIKGSAAVALGKIKDPRAVEPLIKALKHPERDVREAAAVALGRIEDPRAVEPLIEALKDASKLEIEYKAAEALGRLKDPRAVEPLIAVMRDDPRDYVRSKAVEAMAKIRDPHAVSALLAALNEHNAEVIAAAHFLFIELGEPASESALIDILKGSPHNGLDIAREFLSCGNPRLELAAREWAASRGYPITRGTNGGFFIDTSADIPVFRRALGDPHDDMWAQAFLICRSPRSEQQSARVSATIHGVRLSESLEEPFKYACWGSDPGTRTGSAPRSPEAQHVATRPESSTAAIAAPAAKGPVTILSAESVEALRRANAVRALQPLEEGNNVSSLAGGVYGFTVPWIINSDSSRIMGGTGVDKLGLRRSSGGTFVMEIHKRESGEVYVVGYLSEADLARLQNPSRTSDAQSTLFFSPYREFSLAVAIPLSCIKASKNRHVDGRYADDISVGVVKVSSPISTDVSAKTGDRETGLTLPSINGHEGAGQPLGADRKPETNVSQGIAHGDQRLAANAHGSEALVWKDPATKLTWTRQDNGSDVSWHQARDYCISLDGIGYAGYTGWRLPKFEELRSIYEPSRSEKTKVKEPLQINDGSVIWSAELNPAASEAVIVLFGTKFSGIFNPFGLDDPRDARALCVRR